MRALRSQVRIAAFLHGSEVGRRSAAWGTAQSHRLGRETKSVRFQTTE
jgi:hypothetical protein